MKLISRIAVACATLVTAPVALSGCALQADWNGSNMLASEECVLAALLFSPSIETPVDAPEVEVLGDDVLGDDVLGDEMSISDAPGDGAGQPTMSRAELAAALRSHVPVEMHEILGVYALPEPVRLGGESEEFQAKIIEVLNARSLAEESLQGWAQLACGPEIGQLPGATTATTAATADSEWASLAELQAFEGELDGVRTISIAGATEPDHALQVCEGAREQEPDTRIEVTDFDGFPLALAEGGADCEYHPILFEGLELEDELA